VERDEERPSESDPQQSEEVAGAEDADQKPPVEDEVDEASDQSFPASDPPSY
jgi:hypothetical protein